MKHLLFRNFLLPTIFFHSLNVCFSTYDLYNTCLPKTCGDVEINYPFHIVNLQKPYCGYPGFEVSCSDSKLPYLNISGNTYVIKNISYDRQQFQVVNSAFLVGSSNNLVSNCSSLSIIKNMTLDKSVFSFSKEHDEAHHVILFQNCAHDILHRFNHSMVGCEAVGIYGNDTRGRKELERKCEKVVSVPYDDDVGSKNRSIGIGEVLKKGVLLNWIASNCSACSKTHGQCGFDANVSEFKCFCPDRSHAYHCPIVEADAPKNKNMAQAIGLSVAGGTFLLTALGLIFLCRKKLKFNSKSVSLEHTAASEESESRNVYFGVPLFSYTELVEATDNFNHSRELGDGGFGIVYHGILRDGREVAVKRLFEKSYKRVEQFVNEIQILTCLRHTNLVTLYGCTSQHSKELLLVYEFVPNGTVADHLYGDKAKPGSLPWPVRMRIAIETASALSYLHASEIIHRDIKTNNILLDTNFCVKVADFGLSRLFPIDVTHVSTAPQGTPGYLDPEYHQCYHLTDKSDVYSFGVVLMELISSLPAVDMNRHKQEINLSNFAMKKIQQRAFEELVDPHLGFTSDNEVKCMTTAVAELAFQCLQSDNELRPTMEQVLETLKNIEGTDYKVSKIEKRDKNDQMEGSIKTLPLPIRQPCSPDSVMGKWLSKSTTPNMSK